MGEVKEVRIEARRAAWKLAGHTPLAYFFARYHSASATGSLVKKTKAPGGAANPARSAFPFNRMIRLRPNEHSRFNDFRLACLQFESVPDAIEVDGLRVMLEKLEALRENISAARRP